MNHPSSYRLRRTLALVFASTQWVLLAPAVRGDDPVPLVARTTGITGNARYVDKNHRNWTELRVGDEFSAGSALQTNSKDSTADIDVGSDAGGRRTIRMFSNSVLKLIQLNSKKSGSVQARDIELEMAAGQIRVSLDGVSDYSFTLIYGGSPTRVTVPRSARVPRKLFSCSMAL